MMKNNGRSGGSTECNMFFPHHQSDNIIFGQIKSLKF